MTSVVIMMITLSSFLTSCDSENQSTGSSGVEADRPVERFEFKSGEQLEQLINSLKATRSEHGNHKIASYETPLQSVIAYMLNLNTHRSYETLRARRAELRRAGTKVTGWELVKTLTKYSERGQEYVDSLHALMKTNMLKQTDDAYLGDGPTILLIPVGDGT